MVVATTCTAAQAGAATKAASCAAAPISQAEKPGPHDQSTAKLPRCSSARRQCTAFCAPVGAARRQSITMLARLYASSRLSFLSLCRSSIIAHEASSIALLRSASLPTVTRYALFSLSGNASILRVPAFLAVKQWMPLLTSTTWLIRQSQVAIITFSACSVVEPCAARSAPCSSRP